MSYDSPDVNHQVAVPRFSRRNLSSLVFVTVVVVGGCRIRVELQSVTNSRLNLARIIFNS